MINKPGPRGGDKDRDDSKDLAFQVPGGWQVPGEDHAKPVKRRYRCTGDDEHIVWEVPALVSLGCTSTLDDGSTCKATLEAY